MTHYPYLFDKSPEQLRELGARGGRTSARNRRLRLGEAAPEQSAALRLVNQEWNRLWRLAGCPDSPAR